MVTVLIDAYTRMVTGLGDSLSGWRTLEPEERREWVDSLRMILADRWAALQGASRDARELVELRKALGPIDRRLLDLGPLLREMLRIEVAQLLGFSPSETSLQAAPAASDRSERGAFARLASLAMATNGVTVRRVSQDPQAGVLPQGTTIMGGFIGIDVVCGEAGSGKKTAQTAPRASTTRANRVEQHALS